MTLSAFRINEPEIEQWYNKKKNKSDTTRKALKMLYQKELQDDYKQQDLKIVVTDA